MKKIINLSTILIFSLCHCASLSAVNYSLNNFTKNKKTIVIDAGHGGHDSGAVANHVKEKELSLQMALTLGKMIEDNLSDVNVIYTRTSDKFLPLYQRIGIANAQNADLFISIHCNYIGNKNTKGTETFVMGLHRADENLVVAQRENEVILMENEYEQHYEGYDPNSPVGHIVLSLFQDAYLEKSLAFAANVEKNFASRGLSSSRGVKQAGFAVLRRATMPSVLVETGFISNPDEAKWLSSEHGQTQICKGIYNAIVEFFDQKENEYTFVNSETNSEYAQEQFKIQIAAVKNKINEKNLISLAKIGDLSIVEKNGFFKYQIGGFTSIHQAEKAQEKCKALGYEGAFIVKL